MTIRAESRVSDASDKLGGARRAVHDTELEHFRVNHAARKPLIEFMAAGLEEAGCRVIRASSPSVAPFHITFILPNGERMGVIAYAFLANSVTTKNRPSDEHRFQIKYGSKDGRRHTLWQDPFGLYTTILVGIDTERGIFIGADPVLHSPTRFFISVEFKRDHVVEICESGWHVWERERRTLYEEQPVEVLVGGTRANFLRYVLMERDVVAEDQGHRQLVAERFGSDHASVRMAGSTWSQADRTNALVREFSLSEVEILQIICDAPRLKMAVRGWVAEEHLARTLRAVHGVREATRVEGQGDVDVKVTLSSGKSIGIQCKNVLRKPTAEGLARVDFQRTRASIADRCSRYYAPSDFKLVAACMHAVTEKWEFRFAPTRSLDPHPNCAGKLASNVRIDSRWMADPNAAFAQIP